MLLSEYLDIVYSNTRFVMSGRKRRRYEESYGREDESEQLFRYLSKEYDSIVDKLETLKGPPIAENEPHLVEIWNRTNAFLENDLDEDQREQIVHLKEEIENRLYHVRLEIRSDRMSSQTSTTQTTTISPIPTRKVMPKLFSFNGDVLDWGLFKGQIQSQLVNCDDRSVSESTKCARLVMALGEEPKKIISHVDINQKFLKEL